MAREIEDPTVDEHGYERHPAWGMIGASRVTSTPGAVLFDSDIRHNHYVTVRISTARRQRNLNRDWLMADSSPFVEVAMSEAQWASFVSSMNAGQGVPCTVERREDDWRIPGFPYEPRLQESMNEVRGAADKAAEAVAEAFAAYAEKKTAANLRNLEFAIKNMPANVTFAASSLTKHAENVVQRARADIEAMVMSKAKQLGIEPSELGLEPAQLMAPDEQ